MRTLKNRTATALGVVALAGSGITGIALSDSAQAADRDGKCDKGEFCYNYNSDLKGSWSDFSKSVGDYGTDQPSCYEFKGAGKGKGKCIKNDAGGYFNNTDKPVTIYFNSNHGGKSVTVKPGDKGKLPAAVYNDNASHRIGKDGGDPPPSGGEHVLPFPCGETWKASIWSGHSPSDNSVDFNHYPTDDGWKVYASKAGTVDSAGTGAGGYGNTVVINHGNGEQTRYAHLKSMNVKAGDKVTAKTNIGRVGQSGGQPSTHLHYEQIKGGTVVRPKFKDGSPKWMTKTDLQRKSACP